MSSSFLDRLKKKDVLPSTPTDEKKEKVEEQNKAAAAAAAEAAGSTEQLKVDIFQTPNAIVVYAQIAGATVNDFSVSIDGDGDVITIKGMRNRPNGEHFSHPDMESKESVLEECGWGKFYRQIILPAEVDPPKTEAKMREGVLMLYLPLKRAEQTGVRINVTAV